MTIGELGGLLFVLIAYGEWRYYCGHKDGLRGAAVKAARWSRRES